MRQALKKVLVGALDASGLCSLLPSISGHRMWIPCYHGVIAESKTGARQGYENTVSASEFEQHLEWLGRHFRFVDLAGALRWLEQPDGGRPPVLISFDDGYRNNLKLAAPILSRFGAPAIFFLSSGYIGTGRLLWPLELDARLEHSPGAEIQMPGPPQPPVRIPADSNKCAVLARELRQQLKKIANAERVAYLKAFAEWTKLETDCIDHELNDFLSWDEARKLAGMGFDIGSHTCEHPILSRLEPEELRIELQGSKDRIEAELAQPVTTIAYPNGGAEDYSKAVVEIAQDCGYQTGFAVDEKFQKALRPPKAMSRYQLSRIIVQGHLPQTQFHFLASGTRNLLRGSL